MQPQSNRLAEGEEEMGVANPSQNYSESQRILSQGGGQRRPRRLGNELVNVTIRRREMDMLEVLRDYGIRSPGRLQDLLDDICDSDDRPQLNIRGTTAFAGARQFSINGGDFVVAGRDLHSTLTYDGQAHGPRLEQTRVEQTMLVESTRSPPGYPQIEAERTSHLQQRIVGQLADATHDIELPIEDEDEMQGSESGPPDAALVAYDSPGQLASRNPSSARVERSVTLAALAPHGSVSIEGSSVLANATNFSFGEGVQIQSGGLSAVGRDMHINILEQ